MEWHSFLTAMGVLAVAPVAAASAKLPASASPPPFRSDRTSEDYSYLRDAGRRVTWSDGFKFIALDEDGRSYLSLGGELRERVETIEAARFGLAGGRGDTYRLQRVLAHADLPVGSNARLFAQIGAHEAIGKRALLPPDEDHFDVQQLFVELQPAPGLSARLGRQEMAFNPLQRFVSFRDGTNVRQNFDGGRLTGNWGPLRVEAFLTRPVALEPGIFDNRGDLNQMFGGVYVSRRLGARGSAALDAYWFRLDREGPSAGREGRHSLGLRFAGASRGVDWDVEGVWQAGRRAGRDVRAWAVSADLGYTLDRAPLRPRFGFRFDAGSGDDDPSDHRVTAFHPLFPSGPYFNEANLTSWTNLVAPRTSLTIKPSQRLTMVAATQFKWREDVDDAVYLGPSTPLAATRGNRARSIGLVHTLDVNLQLNRNLALRAYYLHHGAGEAIEAAGGRPIDFLMASATLRF